MCSKISCLSKDPFFLLYPVLILCLLAQLSFPFLLAVERLIFVVFGLVCRLVLRLKLLKQAVSAAARGVADRLSISFDHCRPAQLLLATRLAERLRWHPSSASQRRPAASAPRPFQGSAPRPARTLPANRNCVFTASPTRRLHQTQTMANHNLSHEQVASASSTSGAGCAARKVGVALFRASSALGSFLFLAGGSSCRTAPVERQGKRWPVTCRAADAE